MGLRWNLGRGLRGAVVAGLGCGWEKLLIAGVDRSYLSREGRWFLAGFWLVWSLRWIHTYILLPMGLVGGLVSVGLYFGHGCCRLIRGGFGAAIDDGFVRDDPFAH
ncbi:uncharacterized protein BO95DRAFT_27030 [Aspergillus brunneoviolaceus CBS 621.78]|uniref:Uncharacterized protein n=1 Tax=Aspergillus brunneoviolaceus CBS 621.78 TaxID=1450534 RepID=A0ACD1GIM0_9EURO|nr:hypothetical protein BO95DRAFT_27030 [Aspergillus brunneoviolaceus CBS 621.78]RAH49108.1 hypothetical protein BO95DRAFT_27030 [Aspergillus brunneoviolaceus CBS 621.78]